MSTIPLDLQGTHVFGPAYAIGYERSVHAPGSVDRVMRERMTLLCDETAAVLYDDFTPIRSTYSPGSLQRLEVAANEAVGRTSDDESRIVAVGAYCATIVARCEAADPDDLYWEVMQFGGTEEEIIARGSDWCADMARVAAGLLQVFGMPSRLVDLVDDLPYGGHVMVEAFRGGVWGALDPLSGHVYRRDDGTPQTIHDLLADPGFLFRRAAIMNYAVADRAKYLYPVHTLGGNEYQKSILRLAIQGWPGGRRWLHGEEGQ